ncbi:MAG: class II D-tagatose-bisphosphate aldolase non-catalytic subunit, partial [bacterium]
EYSPDRAGALSNYIEDHHDLVYEAHSTDYQTRDCLRQMVKDHFAILKVGPALTFAFREAVFALARMEREYLDGIENIRLSELPAVLDRVMCEEPKHWKKHYHGSDQEQAYARIYSYSDRSRYYWPNPQVQEALKRLLANVTRHALPETLLSQHLPNQYHAVRSGRIQNSPTELILHRIMEVTGDYAYACGAGKQQGCLSISNIQ